MRKTLAVASMTSALLFGGAGVANAGTQDVPAPSATTTTLADTDNNQRQEDNSGKWGLLGLLGLTGLAGLLRRDRHPAANTTATHVGGPGPRP